MEDVLCFSLPTSPNQGCCCGGVGSWVLFGRGRRGNVYMNDSPDQKREEEVVDRSSVFLKGVTFAAEEGENGASGSPVSMEMDNENSGSSFLVIEPSEEGGNEEEGDEGEEENDAVLSLSGSKLFGFFIADGGSRSIWVDSIQLTPPHEIVVFRPANKLRILRRWKQVFKPAMDVPLYCNGCFLEASFQPKGRSGTNFLGLYFGP